MDAESQEIRQAHQRASVKWLLSKAFNNRVPDNLKEPFYRDHENQERLKPQIIVDLGNALLYCQTLSNLYSDPNYQSSNHWSIIQTLSRKGIPISELSDVPLTETILIQTNPLRINAHMAVIEALMILYAKEVTSSDRVFNAIQRIAGNNLQTLPQDQTYEQLLLTWVSYACAALKRRIAREVESGAVDNEGVRLQVPDVPPIRDYQTLCDGISLALLISNYCPKALPWSQVRINYLPAVEDSIHNILLVSNFSQKHLPYNVFHMNPEDITYMRGSMKLNLVVLLADLFNLFEIHPAKCVCYPGMDTPEAIAKRNLGTNEHGICHRRGLTVQPVTPIPHLRSESESTFGSPTNRPPFQVSYSIPASSNTTPSEFRMSEVRNSDSNQVEAFVVHKSRGVTTLASIHSQQPQQEALIPARLRPLKEKSNSETKADERGDNVAAGKPSNWEQNRRPSYAGRRSRRNSSSEDSQLTIENFGGSQDQLNTVDRFDRERGRERERKLSNASVEPAVAIRSSVADARGSLQLGYDTDSGSEKQDHETEKYTMRRQPSSENVSIHVSNTHLNSIQNTNSPMPSSSKQHSIDKDYAEECLSESAVPTKGTAAWNSNQSDIYEGDMRTLDNASKLSNICFKLEEKRRRIEQEKRRVEMALMRYQEKTIRENSDNTSEAMKWETMSNDSNRTPDIESHDLDKYQQSLAVMNMNLQDIQQDIQKLTAQQSQIQAQQIQAQQLIQAQHVANMLNQSYGSQQHLSENFHGRNLQQQHNFGSTPHLAHSSFNPHISSYSSRPPSRDPYQQAMPPMPLQYINEHGQYISQHQQPSVMHQPPLYMQSQNTYMENMAPFNNQMYGGPQHYGGHHGQPQPQSQFMIRQSGGYDDYPQYQGRDTSPPQSNNLYPHEMSPQPSSQRRTWNQSVYEQQQQQQQNAMPDVNSWQQQKRATIPGDGSFTWRKQQQYSNHAEHEGFVLHQNDGGGEYHHLFQVQSSPQQAQMLQHEPSTSNIGTMGKKSTMPMPDDVMAPQSICFIGDEEDVEEIERNIIESMQATRISDYAQHRNNGGSFENYEPQEVHPQKLNITSGNLTYRIPSPSRPSLNPNNFQDPRQSKAVEKGFYISLDDDDQPKRPKPPLRAKRSPKKEKSMDSTDHQPVVKRESFSQLHNAKEDNNPSFNNGVYSKPYNNNISNSNNKTPDINTGTYNKYTDAPIQLRADDAKNSSINQLNTTARQQQASSDGAKSKALVIGTDANNLDPESIDEMERRKEKIMLLSLQRRQQQEEAKARKEIEAAQKREKEREKEEERARKKEEQIARRAAILEQHRLKKAIEEAEREGKTLDRSELGLKPSSQNMSTPRLRQQRTTRPRPKTIHVDDASVDLSEASSISSRSKKGSSTNLAESPDEYPSASSTPIGRRGSYKTSRESAVDRGRSRISVAKGSSLNFRGRKSNSLMNLCDSGLGRATPPRRAPSPGMAVSGRHMPSPSGPGSLPPGLISKRRGFEDGSHVNPMMEYSGPKLYKQPAAKSNRGIILNAVEYCVFPGAVNREAKQKVMEKIARSEAKHFLVLFRDAGCQFRALYSYVPETDQVTKLYGTGPTQVDEVMFDKFFKYNSGGKCFSQIHTKHLTVTIDAFTIHNSLWQGKKVHLPSKKDMALVI